MAVLAGDERLRKAHERAASKGFAELERFASRQRNTRFTRDTEFTGNLCAAAFTHDASRALDPQLHTHFVVANATCDPSGQWYALEECQMLKAIRYAGKVYQNELAREVQALGYRIRETRGSRGEVTGFEIDGIPEELCTRFAKRRKEIEREIAQFERKHGREPTSAEVARITRDTRDVKLAEITTPEVREQQLAQLRPGEWEQLQTLKADALVRAKVGHVAQVQGKKTEAEALRAAVDHLFERQSVATEHELLAEALNQSLGSIDLETLQRTLASNSHPLVRLTTAPALQAEYATRHGLELERWSVAFVNATKDRFEPLNAAFAPSGSLSAEQDAAVRAILSTRDQVFSLRGVAGAGKTTTLRELHRGLEGRTVHYVAPTTAAAKVLREEGFENATTVEDFLCNVSRREPLRDAVVICDEAGLKSNRQGAELLRLAHQYRMRVLLVGDIRQHVSVESGDFLRVLEVHSQLGRCEIAEIRRQAAVPAYKSAVMRLAAGDARGGLAALDALGWLKESEAGYLQAAACDYLRLTRDGADLERCLAVAPTWAENHRLTNLIRNALRVSGRLAGDGTSFQVFEPHRWTVAQKRNPRNYSTDQVITFSRATGNWQPGEAAPVHRVTNGHVFLRATDGSEQRLDLRKADAWETGVLRPVEITAGDKLLI